MIIREAFCFGFFDYRVREVYSALYSFGIWDHTMELRAFLLTELKDHFWWAQGTISSTMEKLGQLHEALTCCAIILAPGPLFFKET